MAFDFLGLIVEFDFLGEVEELFGVLDDFDFDLLEAGFAEDLEVGVVEETDDILVGVEVGEDEAGW